MSDPDLRDTPGWAHVYEGERDYLNHGSHEAQEAKTESQPDWSMQLEMAQPGKEGLLLLWSPHNRGRHRI